MTSMQDDAFWLDVALVGVVESWKEVEEFCIGAGSLENMEKDWWYAKYEALRESSIAAEKQYHDLLVAYLAKWRGVKV